MAFYNFRGIMHQLHLVPAPRATHHFGGSCPRHTDLHEVIDPSLEPEAYRLEIVVSHIQIAAADVRGLAYGRTTLEQIRAQCADELPQLRIDDAPCYPVRGLYHDVSRGKVPTLSTLLELADICARLKLNQLQLYIEHTYAYVAFPEVWQDADPLTAEEIRTLDAHCASLHIELVPSFSTFGHFYNFLRQKRFAHLNEMECDLSLESFNWFDRMHQTLDCSHPESIQLVSTLIREVRPLFRSNQFNICADETFELGEGKNRAKALALGKGRLYLDFVKQIIEIVHACGSRPMMWGDIIQEHPALLSEIPPDVTLLEWGYAATIETAAMQALQEQHRPFFVCSGTQAWNRFLPDYPRARENISNMATEGFRHRASGYLVTDWGDFGHIAPLAASLPSIAYAAACAWNVAQSCDRPDAVEHAISLHLFNDPTGQLLRHLNQAASVTFPIWHGLALWKQPRPVNTPDSWFDPRSGIADELLKTHRIEDHLEALRAFAPARHACLAQLESIAILPKDGDDLRVALLGTEICHELGALLFDLADRNPQNLPVPEIGYVVDRLKLLETEITRIWLARNKRSELIRISELLQAIADDLLKRLQSPASL